MKKTFNRGAIATAIAFAISGQAFAADTDSIERKQTQSSISNEKAEESKVEKIVVTGSRLRRDSFSVATPLVTMDLDEIQDTGLGSLSEILVDGMPAISEGSSNSNSQSSVQNTGLSTIDLRNLGTNRTLTLVDGRRVVSNSYSGNYVSLSTIPSGMVQRVEIISGGASATYGSDAIAGVVNIITQTDKEGFGFKARSGESTEGGAKEFTLDLNYGTSFDNDRGYMYFSTNWERQFGLTFDDRDQAQIEDSYRYNASEGCNQMLTEDGYQCMRDISQADWRSRSDGTLGGVFGEYSKNDTQFWYDESGLRSDWKDNEEKYGINSQQYVALKVPDDALSSAVKINYDITDDLTSYFQVQLSQNHSVNNKSPEDEYEGAYALTLDPETGAPGRVKPGYISMDNPYVPQEIKDAGLYKDRIYWDRRFDEVGNIVTDNERTTMRSWAGLQGVVFDGEWDWDLSVGYGKFKQEQTRYNELNTFRVANALDAEYADDGVTIQCADADARAEGCAPLNLFGIGSISTEAADYIRSNPTITTDIEQINVLGYVAGDLFEMPAGTVSAVFGAEYRRDSQKVKTSDEQQYGGITFNVVPSFEGEVEVYEAFAEAAFPLLKDAPLAKNLTAELSARIADYSMENVGMVSSYKMGLIWEPIEGYMVRGNYSRAQRAPTITELMSPPRGDYDSFNDICDGLTATSTGAGHDKCRLEPTLAEIIATEGEFEDDNNSYSPNTGNSELKEETADTYTFGLTMAPSQIKGLRIAIDYYDIEVTDAISQISNQNIISECYDSSAEWGDTNSFCNDISRDDEGNIIEILQRSFNLDSLTSRGYDVAVEYRFDLDDLGRLKLKGDLTHVIENSQTYEGNDGFETVQYAGQLNTDVFTDKASVSLTWYKDDLRVRWSTKYKSDVISSQSRQETYDDYIADNTAACTAGDDSCVENPETLAYHNIPSYVKHSLSVSYNMDIGTDSRMRLFGGVNNIFDNTGPFVLGGKGNFDSNYGGGVGRFAYLGAEVKF